MCLLEVVKTPVKTFLIFDEDFQIGRINNRTYRSQAELKDFYPGSMTGATIHLEVKLDSEGTGWGPFGTDEFVVGVWANNSSGDPTVEVILRNKEYSKFASAPVSLRYGTNYFYLEVNHGKATELGEAKGHVKVWIEVQYSDPNNPPGGKEPVNVIEKVKRWIEEHPLETALIGFGGLLVYTQTQPKKKKKKKVEEKEEETEVQNIIILPGGITPQQLGQTVRGVAVAGVQQLTQKVKPAVKQSAEKIKWLTGGGEE